MAPLFMYFIKSSGLIAAFFLAYHFLLRRETFFNSNRWYLLVGLLISIVLPGYYIKKVIWIERPKITAANLMTMASQMNNKIIAPKTITASINWTEIVTIGYLVIVAFLFLKFILNIISLLQLLYKKNINRQDNIVFVDLQENIAPFSFLNFIVFNSSLYSQSELESIILHEKVHSHQKHSLDVLIAKLFCIAFWFNPIIWLYKKAIVQNLEYIADRQAIQHIEDKKRYQMALLKVVSHQNCLPITNHFYQSLIKKRIVMLNKNQSNKRNSWKYAIVIPALIAFVFLFQIQVVAQEKDPQIELHNTESNTFINWNKDTSNEELKNDIKMVKEQGITLKYSKLKRNENGEIIAIKVEFKDAEGNLGTTQFSGKNPIKPIKFYKTDTAIGFGEPNNKEYLLKQDDAVALKDKQLKTYKVVVDDSISENDAINVEIPEPPTPLDPNSNAIVDKRILIKRSPNGIEKPIVIVNGKRIKSEDLNDVDPEVNESTNIISDDYLAAVGSNTKNNVIYVTTRDRNRMKKEVERNVRIQMDRMRPQLQQAKKEAEKARIEMDRIRPKMMQQAQLEAQKAQEELMQAQIELENSKPEMEKAKAEMIQAKEELIKAKAEMDKARAEMNRARAEISKGKSR